MKKFLVCLSIFLSLVPHFGCATQQLPFYVAPSELPHTTREMKTAGFWINRHPSSDEIVMNPLQIAQFNAYIQNELKLTKDITQLPQRISAADLKPSLENQWQDFRRRNLFRFDGTKASNSFFEEIKVKMNWEDIPEEIIPQFGFVVHYTDQRLLPTQEGLSEKPFDIDFDELQNSALDMGTPVVILHQSRDGEWYYVESESSDGWVKVEDIVLGGANHVRYFLSAVANSFVVVVKSKADIYLNPELTEHYDYAQMGTKFPLQDTINHPEAEGEVLPYIDDPVIRPIMIPTRDGEGKLILGTGYIQRKDVNEGFLPYTPRHTIEQAFELLNAPYGWGGMYGEQDCSRFLQEVFATVGINLPRNSSAQAQVGVALAKFDQDSPEEQKLKVLKDAISGITILPMRGHIMLFLGVMGDRPFAIHAAWAYREPSGLKDQVRIINRVAVTDLFLGEGSGKGSLLQRLNAVVVLKNFVKSQE